MVVNQKRIVIIGATSAIAEHCARLWVKDDDIDLTLVGRNKEKTERIAADLRIRNPRSILRVVEADFIEPASIVKLVESIVAEGSIHIVLIAHGTLPDQSVCQQDLTTCRDALVVNAISPVLFAEAFVGHMEKAKQGTLEIVGSVAGDRGRKSNYVYGAAKGLIERYAQGLQHRVAKSCVKVVLIKPGPTETPMTAHLKQQLGTLANVEDVAQIIVRGTNHSKPVIYAPAKWSLIMLIIKKLPRFIFNRMDV